LLLFIFKTDVLSNIFVNALPFVAIPFLLWLAFRFDSLMHMSGYIAASLVAIYFTSQDFGPRPSQLWETGVGGPTGAVLVLAVGGRRV
jgi:integral membrane sensor domain MASE1